MSMIGGMVHYFVPCVVQRLHRLREFIHPVTNHKKGSIDIICRVAFGGKYDEEGAQRSRFHGLFNDTEALVLSFFVSDYIPFLG